MSLLLVDAVLVVLVVEAIFLALRPRRWLRALRFRDLAANLGAGFCLVVAVRTALVEGASGVDGLAIAAWLAAAGAAHATDLVVRARR